MALSVDRNAAALTDNGSLACWGNPIYGNIDCPAGPFVQVAMGAIHGCGLDAVGTVKCWGAGELVDEYYEDWKRGQAEPPAGTFATVAAGKLQSCALDGGGALTCWGDEGGPSSVGLPTTGRYSKVSLGTAFGCALTLSGNIECWGYNDLGQADPPAEAGWIEVTAGVAHACALDADGYATCWGGINWQTIEAPQDVQFLTLSAGSESTCGITVDHSIRCWEDTYNSGYADAVLDSPPAGTFEAVDVAFPVALGLSAIGDILCFGDVRVSDLANIPELPP